MKKFKWVLSAVVILTIAAFTYAFTSAKHKVIKHAPKDGTEYVFTGNDISQVRTAADYEELTGSEPSCSGSSLPCIIRVPNGETLQQYLDEHDASYILENAVATKD